MRRRVGLRSVEAGTVPGADDKQRGPLLARDATEDPARLPLLDAGLAARRVNRRLLQDGRGGVSLGLRHRTGAVTRMAPVRPEAVRETQLPAGAGVDDMAQQQGSRQLLQGLLETAQGVARVVFPHSHHDEAGRHHR